jgi:hypothetical protein
VYLLPHISLIPGILRSEAAKVHERDIFADCASGADQDSKRMGQMQSFGEGARDIGVQQMLQNSAQPVRTVLPHQIQIKIRHKTISDVWIDWVNGRPLHK